MSQPKVQVCIPRKITLRWSSKIMPIVLSRNILPEMRGKDMQEMQGEASWGHGMPIWERIEGTDCWDQQGWGHKGQTMPKVLKTHRKGRGMPSYHLYLVQVRMVLAMWWKIHSSAFQSREPNRLQDVSSRICSPKIWSWSKSTFGKRHGKLASWKTNSAASSHRYLRTLDRTLTPNTCSCTTWLLDKNCIHDKECWLLISLPSTVFYFGGLVFFDKIIIVLEWF